MNSRDARTRYTRMMIEASFMKLLKKKHISKITVTQICEDAQINRATFYRHYLDVPNVLEQIEASIFQNVRKLLDGRTYYELLPLYTDIMRYMQQNRDLCFILASDNCDPSLPVRMLQLAQDVSFPLLKRNVPRMTHRKQEMLHQYLSCGCAGIMGDWVRNGMKDGPEEVIPFMLKLCENTVRNLN